MRIYDTPQQLTGAAAGTQSHRTETAAPGKAGAKGAVAQAPGDEVRLSALASRETAAAAAGREERVAHIASVYARGAYSVDAEAVASSMIDDATVLP